MAIRLERPFLPKCVLVARVTSDAEYIALDGSELLHVLRKQHLVEESTSWVLDNLIVGFDGQEQLARLEAFLFAYKAGKYRVAELSTCQPMTIGDSITMTGHCIRQTSCPGRYGVVTFRFAPGPTAGYSALQYAEGEMVPEELRNEGYANAMFNGLARAAIQGRQFGRPVVDFEATLVEAKYHVVDSNHLAFQYAAYEAFQAMLEHATLIPRAANTV
jgi:Elongation factor G, domain IV